MSGHDFAPGQHVLYVPYHAHGDHHHQDCEKGIVTSVRDDLVFVRFQKSRTTSQGCKPDQLQHREPDSMADPLQTADGSLRCQEIFSPVRGGYLQCTRAAGHPEPHEFEEDFL